MAGVHTIAPPVKVCRSPSTPYGCCADVGNPNGPAGPPSEVYRSLMSSHTGYGDGQYDWQPAAT